MKGGWGRGGCKGGGGQAGDQSRENKTWAVIEVSKGN